MDFFINSGLPETNLNLGQKIKKVKLKKFFKKFLS